MRKERQLFAVIRMPAVGGPPPDPRALGLGAIPVLSVHLTYADAEMTARRLESAAGAADYVYSCQPVALVVPDEGYAPGDVPRAVERVDVEVFSPEVNAAVVRMPGRRFPGVVIQGDTLSTFLADAEALVDRLKASDDELKDDARFLRDRLAGFLDHYEAVLAQHGLQLPYVRKK